MSVPHFRNRQDRERPHTLGQADLHSEVTTFYDNDRTEVRVALLGEDGQEFYGEGVARLRPGDHYDKALGQHIAFLRAMQEATQDALLTAIDASVTEDQYQRSLEDEEPEAACDGTCPSCYGVTEAAQPEEVKEPVEEPRPRIVLLRIKRSERDQWDRLERLVAAANAVGGPH